MASPPLDSTSVEYHRRHHVTVDVVELRDDDVDLALFHLRLLHHVSDEQFETQIVALIHEWLLGAKSADVHQREIRLSIPIEQAHVVPVAAKHGFDFVNAHPGLVKMVLRKGWLKIRTNVDVMLSPKDWEHGSSRPLSLSIPTHVRSLRPVKKVLLLYNPFAGAKQGHIIAQGAFETLTSAGVEVHMIRLQRAGHAKEICSAIDLKNFDCVAPVGGDGTLHECLNGLMSHQDVASRLPIIAPIPAGTGNSFVLEVHGTAGWQDSVMRIIRGLHVPFDLLKLTFEPSSPSTSKTVWSFNSVHWGLGAQVNLSAEKLRWIGHAVRYSTAAFFELLLGGKKLASISLTDAHGSTIQYSNEKFCLAIINNIRGATKGMVIAPDACLNDGLVDVLLVRSDYTADLVKLFQGFHNAGAHVRLPFVEYRQVQQISISTASSSDGGNAEILDVDGELLPCASFSAQVVPGGCRIIV